MENNPHTDWKLRAGGIISILCLLFLGMFEAYSAVATAFDRRHALTSWEPHLGWALFVLPIMLITSLFLLHGRRSRFGFWLVVINVCLYSGFLIFESVAAYDGQPVSKQAMWEVGEVYLALFLAALLAAYFLKKRTQAIRS